MWNFGGIDCTEPVMMVPLGLEVTAPATPNIAFNFLLKLPKVIYTGKALFAI